MADDTTLDPPATAPPAGLSKDERRRARARSARLTRLPWLYDYSLRGRRQALVVALLQALVAVVPALVVLRLATGSWFPAGAGLWLLLVTFAQQGLFRRLNAKAGRS